MCIRDSTAVINPDGKIQSLIPPYEPAVLTDTVQPMEGPTPLQTLNVFPLFFIGIFLYLLARKGRTQTLHPTDKPWSGILFAKAKHLNKKKKPKK